MKQQLALLWDEIGVSTLGPRDSSPRVPSGGLYTLRRGAEEIPKKTGCAAIQLCLHVVTYLKPPGVPG